MARAIIGGTCLANSASPKCWSTDDHRPIEIPAITPCYNFPGTVIIPSCQHSNPQLTLTK